MKITLDIDFDSGAWPGPLFCDAPPDGPPAPPSGRPRAAFGKAWLGPAGLLTTLETALGIPTKPLSRLERVAAFLPRVRQEDGFWSASAEADALATAETLLNWRDVLWHAGWRGPWGSPRLAQLFELTRDVPPGVPDRLIAVERALLGRSAGIESIRVLHGFNELTDAWRRVFTALEKQRTTIIESKVPPPDGTGRGKTDLATLGWADFAPQGDGTLQLVRPPGPLQAAEEVAAWLAANFETRDVSPSTLIITPDEVLDAALARFGVPTVGAALPASENVLLQLLPLVLALGYKPPDPQRALELLTLPQTPFPRRLARGLVAALNEVPAVESEAWDQAITEGLSAIDDEGRRQRVEARVQTFLVPRVERGSRYPTAEVTARAQALAQWLAARGELDEEHPDRWVAPRAQISAFLRVLQLSELTELAEPELVRLIQEATAQVGGTPVHDALAGVRSVGAPGAVAGPVSTVVWWDFTLARAPSVRRFPFSAAEREELAGHQVYLPEPANEAIALAARWRRPFEQTTGTLLLVCPETDAGGETSHPHPAWDEIVANVARGHDPTSLVHQAPRSPQKRATRQRQLRPLPMPVRRWQVERHVIQHRPTESASSLGKVVGCPFSWVAEYSAKLYGGQTAELPSGTQLLGSFLHAVLEGLLRDDMAAAQPRGQQRTPDQAATRAGQLFDQLGPRYAAALFLPGANAEQARARRMAVESARALFVLLRDHDRSVRAVEAQYEAEALGTRIAGRADLVLEPLSVIDFKGGSASYKRKELEAGTAYQLAVYARLLQGRRRTLPPVAYFTLANQELLTTHPGGFPGAVPLAGPGIDETWAAVEKAYAIAWNRLNQGEVTATAIEAEDAAPPKKSSIASGILELTPPCRFCDKGALCGAAFGDDDAVAPALLSATGGAR